MPNNRHLRTLGNKVAKKNAKVGVVGLAYVDWGLFAAPPSVTTQQLTTSALLLIFAFGGYEVVPVLGGETKDPRRTVPFALLGACIPDYLFTFFTISAYTFSVSSISTSLCE